MNIEKFKFGSKKDSNVYQENYDWSTQKSKIEEDQAEQVKRFEEGDLETKIPDKLNKRGRRKLFWMLEIQNYRNENVPKGK